MNHHSLAVWSLDSLFVLGTCGLANFLTLCLFGEFSMWLFGSFVIRMNAPTRGESNIGMIQHCRLLFVCLAMNDV